MTAKDLRVLVVDDEQAIRYGIKHILEQQGASVSAASDAPSTLETLDGQKFDLVFLEMPLHGDESVDLLRKIKRRCPEAEVVVITNHATLESAVDVMREGAFDYVPKPFSDDLIRQVVKNYLEKQWDEQNADVTGRGYRSVENAKFIIGESKTFREIYRTINKAGPTDCTVLICGESGTGKELVAREIHRHSNRRNMPFITVDCGVIVESLFESELFGHMKGAYTGATDTRQGWFQMADGGSLFLDEITNISTNIQAKLLRVIQEKEVKPVGSNKPQKADVRIIAATNRALDEEVAAGRFRGDLYYRLSVFPINLPPLRDRKEDIIHLANYFVRKFCRANFKEIVNISDRAMDMLLDYDWPGNIRELENVIERATIMEIGSEISSRNIKFFAGKDTAMKSDAELFEQGLTLSDLEKNYIIKVLNICGGKKSQAARMLGIDRKSLYNRIQKYSLEKFCNSGG